MSEYTSLLPWPDQKHMPGDRLRLSVIGDGYARLFDETTLPERVTREDANQVTVHARVTLTPDQLRWLHKATGEAIAALEDE